VFTTIEETTAKELFGEAFDDAFGHVVNEKTISTVTQDFGAQPKIDTLVKDTNAEIQILDSVLPPWPTQSTRTVTIQQEVSDLHYVPTSKTLKVRQTQQQIGAYATLSQHQNRASASCAQFQTGASASYSQ